MTTATEKLTELEAFLLKTKGEAEEFIASASAASWSTTFSHNEKAYKLRLSRVQSAEKVISVLHEKKAKYEDPTDQLNAFREDFSQNASTDYLSFGDHDYDIPLYVDIKHVTG